MLEAILIFIAIGIIFIVFVPSKPTELSDDEMDLYSDDEYIKFPRLTDDDIKSIANRLIGRARRCGTSSLKEICNDHYGVNFYRSWQFSRIGHYMNRYKFKSDVYPLNDYKIVVIFEDNVNRVGTVTDVIVSKMK